MEKSKLELITIFNQAINNIEEGIKKRAKSLLCAFCGDSQYNFENDNFSKGNTCENYCIISGNYRCTEHLNYPEADYFGNKFIQIKLNQLESRISEHQKMIDIIEKDSRDFFTIKEVQEIGNEVYKIKE